MMTKFFRGAVLGAAVAALAAAVPAGATTLRIAGNFPVAHSSSKAMLKFASEVDTKTGGKLKVETFPAMQLGGAKENVDQVRSGVIFGTWIGAAYLSRTVPELGVTSLPFVYPSREVAFKVMDGPVGDQLNEKLAAKGFTALGWMELGFRNVTNSVHPIKTVDDFKGLKIRVQPDETYLATFRAIGANPVSMGISEVYSALQQGVLDGEENPYAIIASRNFNEVQKYLSDSAHNFDFIVLVVNKRKFDGLPADQQEALRTAAHDAAMWQRSTAAAEDEAAKEELIKKGMVFTPIPAETRAKLQELTRPVIDGLRKQIGGDLVDLTLKEAGVK